MSRDGAIDVLPYWWNASVADAKLRYYLSYRNRGTPSDKVTLFRDVLGFRPDRLEVLRSALIRHAGANRAVLYEARSGWRTYNVVGPLRGPSGASIDQMVTAWTISRGSITPWNATAFPQRRRR